MTDCIFAHAHELANGNTMLASGLRRAALSLTGQRHRPLSTLLATAKYPKLDVYPSHKGGTSMRYRSNGVETVLPRLSHVETNKSYDKDLAYIPQWIASGSCQIESLEVDGEFLEVIFTGPSSVNNLKCRYPLEWLRDVCRCMDCFNHITHNKSTALIPSVPRLIKFRVTEDGETVNLIWEDDHESNYPKNFLFYQHFHSMNTRNNDPFIDAEKKLWDASIPESCFTRFDFESIINDDRSLFEWLRELRTVGLTVIKNSPKKVGSVTKLCERVAYTRHTCFGRTFQVEVKENASHVAYSSGPLPLHTDTAYYMMPVGVQLLHCIKRASSGGENIVADAFRAATKIREEDPECFKVLTSVEFEYFDQGNDYIGRHYLQARHPVIRLDKHGKLEQIVYSDHSRSCRLDSAVDKSPAAYEALRKFRDTLNMEDSVLEYALKDGEILAVDNYRVPHGRRDVDQRSSRHLEGAYLEWDEICSKLRVLGMQHL